MPRPQKHPRTGIYWFRVRVPDDVRPFVRKTEITRTLKTRDPVEAARAHRIMAAEIAAQWEGFRRGAQTLTHKQRVAIAGEMYRDMVAAHHDEPGSPEEWRRKLQSDAFAIRNQKRPLGMMGQFGNRMTEFLERKGIVLSDVEQRAVLKQFGEAVVLGDAQILRKAEGDYSPDPQENRFPKYEAAEKEKAASQSLVALYDLYVGQLGHSPGTIKRWRPKYVQFEEFIAPKSWHQATKQNVIAWMDELLNPKKFPNREKVKPITVRDVHFAAVRALYSFLEEREWGTNPFTGVRVRMPKNDEQVRDKDLREDEARTILRAALEPPNTRMAKEYQDAFKWIPWILAYTGARVNEITQMRAVDVKRIDGVWVFNITPEAGRNKTNKARLVPIHPHLVDMGFLDFATKHKAGPLFYSTARTKGGKDAKAPYKKVGERLAAWVRKHGVSDEAVKPNHGWRHRLSSILIGMRVEERVINAILGHKKGTYGTVRLDLKKEIMDAVPYVDLNPPRSAPAPGRKAEAAEAAT